ncbi:hypothetical protein ACQUFY_26640 (plasmid) [Robbsia andropogonis]|uniref:hypothetical protein n=1 Tax=Robbsia andropogonis TaxID=28092 RepID=UPI003D23DA07
MNFPELNQNNWGVCGFVAALQAAVKNGKPKAKLANDTYNSLYPLITEFCNGHPNLSSELLNFSAIFGQVYSYKSLNEVLNKMRNDVAMTEQIGLAMTAAAVSQLCKDLGFANTDFHGTTATTNRLDLDKLPYTNAIYGIGKSGTGNYRYGLLHWIYVDNLGIPYSWGLSGQQAIVELKRNQYDKLTHYLPGLQ